MSDQGSYSERSDGVRRTGRFAKFRFQRRESSNAHQPHVDEHSAPFLGGLGAQQHSEPRGKVAGGGSGSKIPGTDNEFFGSAETIAVDSERLDRHMPINERRGLFRRPRNESRRAASHGIGRQVPSDERTFGVPNAPGMTPPTPDAARSQKSAHQVLLEFINHINPKTVGLTKMLFNWNPISDNPAAYRYVVNQSTEQSDMAIILRDLTDGRLYRSGIRLVAAPWANLLFGDSFAPSGNKKQVHELIYRRSSCTCLNCLVKQQHAMEELEADIGNSISSAAAAMPRLAPGSAMANFTQCRPMPSSADLVAIGGERSTRELEIGTLYRLHSRAQAKLDFTEDVRLLFGNLAYTGPLSHEALYRNVTTLGVNYYAYNKGKKQRKVYVQGELIRLHVEMGVVKNGAQPMYLKEIGSTFVLYKPQTMSIYMGRIVFEGNSIGSFIETDITFYVGFGQEAGAVAIYPDNRPMGPPRRLGVNELLLHHYQVGDFEVVAR